MPESRRRMLLILAGAAAALIGIPFVGAQMHPSPQPMPSPNAPNQNAPGGSTASKRPRTAKALIRKTERRSRLMSANSTTWLPILRSRLTRRT
jgi:hypothetical protein